MGGETSPKLINRQSELQVYVFGFGKKDDRCLVADKEIRNFVID